MPSKTCTGPAANDCANAVGVVWLVFSAASRCRYIAVLWGAIATSVCWYFTRAVATPSVQLVVRESLEKMPSFASVLGRFSPSHTCSVEKPVGPFIA